MAAIPTSLGTDPQTIRSLWRIVGVLLAVTGTLYSGGVVLFLFRGQLGARAIFATITAAASLIGGTLLWLQPVSAAPDMSRRSTGILGMAIGLGVIAQFSQGFLGGLPDLTDALGQLAVVGLALGAVLLLMASLSLWSKRYAAMFHRRWEKAERRRQEKLGRRR